MTQRTQPPRLMLMDACVLIDFIKTEKAVLELIVNHVGSLYVTSPVIDEVNEIEDENELVALGVIIVEPEIEDAYTAADRSGPLSFADWLCLLTAKRHGFTCVTNDMNLRKLCNQEGVSLLWGLELLAVLHKVWWPPGCPGKGNSARHPTIESKAHYRSNYSTVFGHYSTPGGAQTPGQVIRTGRRI